MINLRILKHPCISRINSGWSWCMTSFIYCWTCWYFVEDFCIYIYQRYWPVIFFVVSKRIVLNPYSLMEFVSLMEGFRRPLRCYRFLLSNVCLLEGACLSCASPAALLCCSSSGRLIQAFALMNSQTHVQLRLASRQFQTRCPRVHTSAGSTLSTGQLL